MSISKAHHSIHDTQYTILYPRLVLAAIACGICSLVFSVACTYCALAQDPAPDAFNKKKAEEPKVFVYNSRGKRDPFTPLVSSDGRFVNLEPPERKSELLIEGIIYDPNGISCAMVNGVVVKVSDFVDSYQVLRIEKDKVVFIKDGQIHAEELKKEEK